MLTIQNKAARPVGYAKSNASANSAWASRNMAVLGTIILVFIVTHMVNFWAKMHFDKNMPLQTITINAQGQSQEFYLTTDGGYLPKMQVDNKMIVIKDRTEFYDAGANVKIKEGYKDLYKITIAFFKDAKYGLIFTLLYVLSMLVLSFHLLHGFSSAFQSLGLNHAKYTPTIKAFGKGFAIVVPLLFAIIPIYIHFFLKA
jgi:succinate dehydrogenase / fumarate reductase cytochrome b subunit